MEHKIRTDIDQMNKYTRELDKVLKSFNTARFRAFIHKHSNYIPHSTEILKRDDEFLEGMMAKMIMNRTTFDGDTRYKAVQILMKLGWKTEIWN